MVQAYGFELGHYVGSLDSSLRKKVEPKRLHPGAILENGATSEGGAVFSLKGVTRVGAELRTMKRVQGWSRFGSTFFSV